MLSTGNTAKNRELGMKVTDVADNRRGRNAGGSGQTYPNIRWMQLRQSKTTPLNWQIEINTIDLVAVNLYPFEKVAARENASTRTSLKTSTLAVPPIRAAAGSDVVVLTDPADYERLAVELKAYQGTSLAFRRQPLKAFARTAQYDQHTLG